MKVNEVIQYATSKLHKVDSKQASNQAIFLVEFLLGETINERMTKSDTDLPQGFLKKIEGCLERRLRGEPIQYIVGGSYFYGEWFKVNASVLIPRPETEILLEAVMQKLTDNKECHLWDVGTGSGILAITIKKHFPLVNVEASDVSQNALEIAKENAKRYKLEKNIEWIYSNLDENMSKQKKFDLIVANLPYIYDRDMEGLPPEVQYEPELALKGGIFGLDLIFRLLTGAESLLKNNGFILLELGQDEQFIKLKEWIEEKKSYNMQETVYDLNQKARVALLQKR